MKILALIFLMAFAEAPASAEITRVEYTQSLRDQQRDGEPRFEYKLRIAGLAAFQVYLERWEWVPIADGRNGRQLDYKDEALLLENVSLEISHGPEDLAHEFVGLKKLEGRNGEGSIHLGPGGLNGTVAIEAPRLATYFPGIAKASFLLDFGARKVVHGTFAPRISEVEEKKRCWEAGEWNSAGCEEYSEVTVWGNEVDALTTMDGLKPFGELEPHAPKGRLRRQGFLRVKLQGHVKGLPVQLRSADGRVLLQTTF